jgi:Holliday junction resolvase RusA-like endonuclease
MDHCTQALVGAKAMKRTSSIEANPPASPPAKRRRGWRPAIRTQFELSMPPAKTAACETWCAAAAQALKEQRACPIPGRFIYLAVYAGLTKRERDLDDILRAVRDLLQAQAIIESDRAIVQMCALWDRTVTPDRVRVEVRQTRGPLQRIGAEVRARLSAQRRGVSLLLRHADNPSGGEVL